MTDVKAQINQTSTVHSILVVAGEKSGENHAKTFLPKLKKSLPHYHFYGLGGDYFLSEGVELIEHLNQLSTWGITGVFKKIFFYLNLIDRIIYEVKKRQTKICILIDYQTFNLKLAEKLHECGVKVIYYVAPQAWGWKPWRAKKIRDNVDILFALIPFEVKWFQDRGVAQVKLTNHPLFIELMDQLPQLENKKLDLNNEIKILLLPGSRQSEVKMLLPVYLEVIKKLKEKFSIVTTLVKTASVSESIYQSFDKEIDHVVTDQDLWKHCLSHHLCLATSGTVTMQTALALLPAVVSYKTDFLTAFIIRRLQIYFGPAALPNIYLGEYVYPECIQENANVEQIYQASYRIITDTNYYDEMRKKLFELQLLGKENLKHQCDESMIKLILETYENKI